MLKISVVIELASIEAGMRRGRARMSTGNLMIEEVQLSNIVFQPKIKGVHDPDPNGPEGLFYILKNGDLLRVLPVVINSKPVFFFDVNHRFEPTEVGQVWRLRPRVQ